MTKEKLTDKLSFKKMLYCIPSIDLKAINKIV